MGKVGHATTNLDNVHIMPLLSEMHSMDYGIGFRRVVIRSLPSRSLHNALVGGFPVRTGVLALQ